MEQLRRLGGVRAAALLREDSPEPVSYTHLDVYKRQVVDEEENLLEVIVPDDQLTNAIGRKGQNVKLAARLLLDPSSAISFSKSTFARIRSLYPRKRTSPNFFPGLESASTCGSLP